MPAARLLFVTTPPLRGPDVLRVQRRLAALGYVVGPLDGVYGPMTAAAVRAFQADRGLLPDAIVGPLTRRALARAGFPGQRFGRGASALGEAALDEARRHIGLGERPGNRTLFGRWFGIDGVPWCAVFVSYCFAVGAGYVLCEGFAGRPGVRTGKGCAYVPTIAAWLRSRGLWSERALPRPGDIVVYNLGGPQDHIGIVESDLGHAVQAVEGNSHDSVRHVRRSRGVVDGFGRVR